MNFLLKIESLVYPRYSILEIFKKLRLVKEALGELVEGTEGDATWS
jgi:hypothetical protein